MFLLFDELPYVCPYKISLYLCTILFCGYTLRIDNSYIQIKLRLSSGPLNFLLSRSLKKFPILNICQSEKAQTEQ